MKTIWILLLLSSVCHAYDWSTNPGDGSAGNPYQISEPNQLIAIGANPDLLDKHFILMNDITFDPNNPNHVFGRALIAPDISTSGLFQGTPFSGSFDGNAYTIFNLHINSTSNIDHLGLFGSADGIIKNLRIKNASISATANTLHHGILAGSNDSLIYNCVVSGAISGRRYLGGLVGWNRGIIQSCTASVSIMGSNFSESLGGLVGDNAGLIHRCSASGTVHGGSDSKWLGGLVGYTAGEILFCYASGDVSAEINSSDLGGLVGYNWTYSEITECYAICSVSGTSTNIGGLVGNNNSGQINTCFWDVETSETTDGVGNENPDPAGAMGKITSEMQIMSTFTSEEWDFVGEEINGNNNIWRMYEDGVDYPRLSWEFGQGGDYACPDGVGMDDLEALAFAWLTADSDPDFNYAADGSGDGRIDQQDMAILSAHWKE